MALPEIICIKSAYNNKYLRWRYDDIQTHGLLQFSGEKAIDSNAQFQVVKARSCDGLVHIKSRYTNNYLVRWSPNHYWITPSAEEQNEDKSNWACTLFKPIMIEEGGAKKMRLVHVQLGHYACLWRAGAPFDSCLFAGSKNTDKDSCDVLTIVDWKLVRKLPSNAAFKGDNGKYLGPVERCGIPYLKFEFDGPNCPEAAHQVITRPDGTLAIKSSYNGKFWKMGNDDWIAADGTDPVTDTNSLFRANHIDINVVAILNMSKTWYCKRYTASGIIHHFNAANPNVDECARLEVTDLGTKLSVPILPKNVAFKERYNQYIGVVNIDGTHYPQFSFVNPENPQVAQQVFTNTDGTISIKSKFNGKFWRLRNDDYVVADASDNCDATTKFEVTHIDKNVVALVSKNKPGLFCKRFTSLHTSLLSACGKQIDVFSTLEYSDLDG